MNNLYKLSNDSSKDIFVKRLGWEIEEKLNERGLGSDIYVNFLPLYRNSGYMLSCVYKEGPLVEILITHGKENNSLIISKFSGIKVYNSSTKSVRTFSSEELRNVAEMYDRITELLEEKFGNSTEQNNASIYRTTLEEKILV